MEIKFLKKEKKFRKKGLEIRPEIYWEYILYVILILVLVSIVFGVYVFIETNKDLALPVVSNDSKEIIGKERFDKVLNYFSEREKKSNEILNTHFPMIDPSL